MRYRKLSPEQKLMIVEAHLKAFGAKRRSGPTVGEICATHGVNRAQIRGWLIRLRERAEAVYERPLTTHERLDQAGGIDPLEREGGGDEPKPSSNPEKELADLEAANDRLCEVNRRLQANLAAAKRSYAALLLAVRMRLPKFKPV